MEEEEYKKRILERHHMALGINEFPFHVPMSARPIAVDWSVSFSGSEENKNLLLLEDI